MVAIPGQEIRTLGAELLVLAVVTGVGFLALGVHAGLYVLVGPVLLALAGGVTSAWLFLTKITE